MIVVIMGVSGSGKTTVGRALAADLGWPFHDADDDHPPANVAKMSRGEPLNDEDRRPWLDVLVDRVKRTEKAGEDLVLACSALKHDYQEYLQHADPDDLKFVYLDGSPELIARRLANRRGHFMDPHLLTSQFEALEPPEHAVDINIDQDAGAIVAEVRSKLAL